MKKIILFFLIMIISLVFLPTNTAVSASNSNFILKELNITPISIVNNKNSNFLYERNSIKINKISLKADNIEYLLVNKDEYFIKNKKYNLIDKEKIFAHITSKDILIDFSLGFSTCFKYDMQQNESVYKNEPVILKAKQKLKDNQNRVVFKYDNINLSSKGISFKIELVFELEKN